MAKICKQCIFFVTWLLKYNRLMLAVVDLCFGAQAESLSFLAFGLGLGGLIFKVKIWPKLFSFKKQLEIPLSNFSLKVYNLIYTMIEQTLTSFFIINSLGCVNQLPFGNQRQSRSMSVLNMVFSLSFFFEMQGHSWDFESVGAKIRKFVMDPQCLH